MARNPKFKKSIGATITDLAKLTQSENKELSDKLAILIMTLEEIALKNTGSSPDEAATDALCEIGHWKKERNEP